MRPSSSLLKALVSIHDVVPETLPRVERILRRLADLGTSPVTLLVVPGKPWSPAQISRLKAMAQNGCELAGHGWRHAARTPVTVYHRIHSRVLSRNAAEHLSEEAKAGIIRLMNRNHSWFQANQLPRPSLYVPPAWALRNLSLSDLRKQRFSLVETLTGVTGLPEGRLMPLPLVGFEADTRTRAAGLRRFNRLNIRLARAAGKPVRIGIHPYDPELFLGDELDALLRSPLIPLSYSDLNPFTASSQPASGTGKM